MDFTLKLGQDDYVFPNIYEPSATSEGDSKLYGITVKASKVPRAMRDLSYIRTAQERRANLGLTYRILPVIGEAPHILMRSRFRPRLVNDNWEDIETLLRQANALNEGRDWIFQRRSIEVTGTATPMGPLARRLGKPEFTPETLTYSIKTVKLII